MCTISSILRRSVLLAVARRHSVKTSSANDYRKCFYCATPFNNRPNVIAKGAFYSTLQSGEATFEEVRNVAADTNENVLLIDVREPEELKETGVIPKSINIPLGELEDALKTLSKEEFLRKYGSEKPDFNQPIIFSCRLGKRSANAQAISQQLGYKNVKNFLGGWLEWEEKNK